MSGRARTVEASLAQHSLGVVDTPGRREIQLPSPESLQHRLHVWMNLDIERRRELVRTAGLNLAWVEAPVDLVTFIESPRYLGHASLSQIQLEAVRACSEIFDIEAARKNPSEVVIPRRQYTEAVLLWGMGAGKDLCAQFIHARLLYLLGCLADPHGVLKVSPHRSIDLLNVAISEDQAEKFFFDPLKRLLRDSPWFMDKLGIRIQDRAIYVPPVIGFDPRIGDMYSITVWSGNSSEQAQLGGDLLCVVLDEIDGFRSFQFMSVGNKRAAGKVTAESMYENLMATVQSRFPGVGKTVMLSWPRYEGSFIMRQLEKGKEDPVVFTSGPFATWEVNPNRSEEEFEVLMTRNPELVRAKYMCRPMGAMAGYFTNTLAVLQAFNAVLNDEMKVEIADEELLAPVDWETMQVISGWLAPPDPSALYCWHIDLALRGCRAAVAMSHHSGWTASEDGPPVPVIDLDMVYWWEAPEGGEIQFSEIRSFVLSFARAGYRTAVVSLDGFQSQDTMQTLRRYTQYGERVTYDRKGNPRRPTIEAGHLSVDVNTKAYDTLKELIYEPGRLRAFYCPLVVKELLGLVYIAGGKKVDHLEGATKDASDAVAGSVFNAVSNLNESLAPAIFGETGPGAVVVGARREGQWGIDDEQINIFDEMPKAIG